MLSHNSGYGSQSTKSMNLRPWTVLAFICGFSGSAQEITSCRYKVERKWKEEVLTTQQRTNRILTREEIVILGKKIIQDEDYQIFNLRFVQAIHFV